MKPIIILNAPARAGKDTVAELLCKDTVGNLIPFKFPLFKIFCQTLDINPADFTFLYEIEGWKDSTPDKMKFQYKEGDQVSEFALDILKKLNGHTPRDFLIHISEVYIKPFFGDDFFGKELCESIGLVENQVEEEKVWIIPDGGFDSETTELVKVFGERIVCIQFTRDGKTFEGDSRGYITNVPNTIKLEHPNDPEQFKTLILNTLKEKGFDI